MTIAVGAKYPWGDLKRLPPSGISIPEAVILASDGRLSRKLPSGHVTASNSGTKLFQLGRDAAAAYAGMSKAGELCLDELRWRLSKQKNPNSTRSKEIAQETLQFVYKHQIALEKLRPDDAPLYILIGACDKRGQAELYLFSYETGFKPQPINGLRALGWPETVSTFDKLLKNELHKNIEQELSLRRKYPQVPMAYSVPMPIKAEHVAILFTEILSRMIESGSDTTIGGMIQCAVISSEGLSLTEIAYSPDPTNEGPGWTRVTAKPEELVTVTGISGMFGFYTLSD